MALREVFITKLFKSEKMDSFEMRCTPVRHAKARACPPSFKAAVSHPLRNETISS